MDPYRDSEAFSGSRYRAPVANGHVRAVVSLPGPTSRTLEEMVASAFAAGPSRLIGASSSLETKSFADDLMQLNVSVERFVDADGVTAEYTISPPTGPSPAHAREVAGKYASLLAPLAGRAAADTTFATDPLHPGDSLAGLIQGLRGVGIDIDDGGSWGLPFTVHGHGHVRGGSVALRANDLERFAPGLLLAAPHYDVGLLLRTSEGGGQEPPGITAVLEMLSRRGVRVERPGTGKWLVEAGSPRARDIDLAPDAAAAAAFMAAPLLVGGEVSIKRSPLHGSQPWPALPDAFKAMGAHVVRSDGALTLRHEGGIKTLDIDLSLSPALAPVVSVLAAYAEAPMMIRGLDVRQLDSAQPLGAVVANLRRLGAIIETSGSSLLFQPGDLSSGQWLARGFPVVALAGALCGLRTDGVHIDGIGDPVSRLRDVLAVWDANFARPPQ